MIDPDDELKTGCPLLPVGFPLGEVYSVSERASYGAIRKGADRTRVALDDYQAWLHSFDAQPRAELVARCIHEAIPEPVARIDSLIGTGFLVELRDAAEDNQDLFERLRLIPLGFGLGNTPDNPFHFEIGQVGAEEALSVDARVYNVWAVSTVPISIAEACRDSNSHNGHDPNRVQGQVALSLPALIAHGLAYLDEYVKRRKPGQVNGRAQLEVIDAGSRHRPSEQPPLPLRGERR